VSDVVAGLEEAIVGWCVADPPMIDRLDPPLQPDMFSKREHAIAWEAIALSIEEQLPASQCVSSALESRGYDSRELLEAFSIAAGMGGSPHACADAVRRAWQLRRLGDHARSVASAATGADPLVESSMDDIQKLADKMTLSDEPSRSAMALKECVRAVSDRLERLQAEGPDWVLTPWPSLNAILGGLRKGELVVVAARPGMGKTAFGLCMALSASGGMTPTPTLFFSLEMGREPLTQRILSMQTRLDGKRLRDGSLREEDWKAISVASDQLADVPLYIDDTPALNVTQVRQRAKRGKDRLGVGLVMVDYLQIMDPGKSSQPRHVQVGELSMGLKRLSREMSAPVVCFAQLSRASEQRENMRPRASDLRESGSIEQDADVVILIHREGYYRQHDLAWLQENGDRVNHTEVIVAKNRNGETGAAMLHWDEARTRFIDPAHMPGARRSPFTGNQASFGDDE
jgi:replicative DNA helicase